MTLDSLQPQELFVEPAKVYRACIDAFIQLFDLTGVQFWHRRFLEERANLAAGTYQPYLTLWYGSAPGTLIDLIISRSNGHRVTQDLEPWVNAAFMILYSLGIESFRLAFPDQRDAVSPGNLQYSDTGRWHYTKSDVESNLSYPARAETLQTSAGEDSQLYLGTSPFEPPIEIRAAQCSKCGGFSVADYTVWSAAATLWARSALPRALANGNGVQAVEQGLAATESPECRPYLDAVDQVVATLGLQRYVPRGHEDATQESPDRRSYRWHSDSDCPYCHAHGEPDPRRPAKYWHLAADSSLTAGT